MPRGDDQLPPAGSLASGVSAPMRLVASGAAGIGAVSGQQQQAKDQPGREGPMPPQGDGSMRVEDAGLGGAVGGEDAMEPEDDFDFAGVEESEEPIVPLALLPTSLYTPIRGSLIIVAVGIC